MAASVAKYGFSEFSEGNLCDLIEQYVSGVVGFSSQYGSDNTISYTACNVSGKPTVYPAYGDFTQTFAMRSYGPWKSVCSADFTSSTSNDFHVISQDFLDVKFERSVFPFRVDIYETYNPGAVVRILACDELTNRWAILWSGRPQQVPFKSRIFSPPLRRINFQSNKLRLEFYHRHLHYHYEMDAVRLVGSSIISFFLHSLPDQTLENGKEEVTAVGTGLDCLPGELLSTILGFLDLESLCRCACVSRIFRKYCYDLSLYRNLNLQPYWHKVTNRTLQGLASRCSALQTLTLNWCRSIDPVVFVRFLEICGRNLRSLNLACCTFVNWECLKGVADFCQVLIELDLQCLCLDQLAFIHVSRLSRLRHLNLYRTPIDTYSLTQILRSCSRIEFLGLGACVTAGDQTVAEISRHGRCLRILDLWRAKSLTSTGIRELAEGCPFLEVLDLGWCLEVDAGTGCLKELVARCTRLKVLLLTSVRTLSDDDLVAVASHCRFLQQLDVLGSRDISCESLLRVLHECTDLKMLDVSFCGSIDQATVQCWRTTFPSVDIKRSYQIPLS